MSHLKSKFDRIDQTEEPENEKIETYSKMIFMSKEQEQEWNEMVPAVKKTVIHFLEEAVYKAQQKIIEEFRKT